MDLLLLDLDEIKLGVAKVVGLSQTAMVKE